MKIADRGDALVRVFVAVAAGALLMSAIAGPATADDNNSNKPVLTFNGGIGVIPVSSVSCVPSATPCVMPPATTLTVTQNTVRGQTPAGQIWVINQLNAQVFANGSIKVSGQGLVLGGGNTAGGAPAAALFATLSCSSTSPFSLSSTPIPGTLPTLSPNGDFQIDAMLSPAPVFPCASPLLLIQSQTNMHWFALGIVSSGNSGH
jgi:hypothetical protein